MPRSLYSRVARGFGDLGLLDSVASKKGLA